LLPTKRIVQIVQKVGCVICGQTDRMVPADKKLYALRDATGAVPSIPLITASILSKKLAENLDALLLDVKFGSAAFMQTRKQASKLAREMVALGKECGVNTHAVLSDMNAPLGRAAGNWLEVKESVECLEGKGPEDLKNLVVNCAAHLLVQTKKAGSIRAGRKLAQRCLDSGVPRQKWDEMLMGQGADLKRFNQKLALSNTAALVIELKARQAGIVSRCDARLIGEVVRDLGGGRHTKDSTINFDVGIDQIAKPGERVKSGSILCRIHAMNSNYARNAKQRLAGAFVLRG
jgi:pyrimidine-nucleoside phosphorylase